MSDDVGDEASAPPETLVRVRSISNLTSIKRHLFRMFDQGQPRYLDAYDADDDPWNLWPEMVPDFVEDWRPISTVSDGFDTGGPSTFSCWSPSVKSLYQAWASDT